jgi:NRPS condensation-like uncharacterized protein
MRIDFGEHLDEAMLAEAFEQSCITFPLVACGFAAARYLRPRWVPRPDAAHEILRVVETRGEVPENDDIDRAFANVPSVERGPQLRAFLVRGKARDSLCLTINHMVCDTVGFEQYISIIARLYSRITAGIDPDPPPFDSRRGIQSILKGLTLKDRLLTPYASFGPNENELKRLQKPVGLAFEKGPFSMLTTCVPAEDFKLLRAAAKTQGFTVNTLFLASLALAWHRVCNVDEFQMPCTIDTRRLAPPNVKRGITNLSGTCLCVIRIAPDDMMEDVMTKYAEEMKNYQQRLPSVSQLVQWEIPMAFPHLRRAKQKALREHDNFPLSTTNMGIIDEDCVQFGTVPVQSAHLAAAVPVLPAFTVALSTFRNKVTVSSSIEGDDAAKNFIHTLFAAMTEELMAFGSRHPMTDNTADSDAKVQHGS